MSILDSIAAHAHEHPTRLAYVANSLSAPFQATLTWQQLADFSDRLATHLVDTLSSDKPVVVYGHKDPLMVVCFVACSKAGRAYVPIDPSVPAARLQDIVREVVPELILSVDELPPIDCGAALTLAKHQIAHLATTHEARDVTAHWIGPEDVYYLIFTSGSTGRPKGVQIPRDCLDNFVAWGQTLCDNAAEQGYVFVNQAPFSFDLSVMDLYLSLSLGGTEFALERQLLESMGTLFERLHSSGATVWVSTPSFVEMCLADPSFSQELMPRLRSFLFCGETLTNRTAQRLLNAFEQAEVYNTYGPTESTVAVTGIRVTQDVCAQHVPLPVGAPKPGTTIRITDDAGNELPEGEKGEIVIVGNTVSTGYFHDDERTRAAFSTCAIDGTTWRSYRTGDEGYLRDGLLFYSGRIDLQIKLHGYRIELEDIEANVAKLPGVRRVAVLPNRKPDGTVRSLTAYVVMDAPAHTFSTADVKDLRRQLADYLPAYMIPRRMRLVDDLPVTNNGKVDRRALAQM